MRYIIVLWIFIVLTFVGLASFPWAVALYFWNNIFQPLGFAYRPGALPVANYVFAVLALSYLFNIVRGRLVPTVNLMTYMICTLVSWMIVCSFMSPYQDYVWKELLVLIKYLLPMLLVTSGLVSYKDVKIVALVLVFSVGLWSAQAGVKGLVSGVTTNMGIKYGQMHDNNDFMAATVGILPFIIILPRLFPDFKYKKLLKLMAYIWSLLCLSAIVFSDSRGAVVGLSAVILYYVVCISKNKLRTFFYFLILSILSLYILPDSFWSRMDTIDISVSSQTEASASSRLHLMKSALRCAIDNPIFGVGPNSWIYASIDYAGNDSEPHSAYIKLAAEIGFVGLVIFTIFVVLIMLRLKVLQGDFFSSGELEKYYLTNGLFFSILGLLVTFIFLNHPYSEFLWAWLAVSASLIRQNMKEKYRL